MSYIYTSKVVLVAFLTVLCTCLIGQAFAGDSEMGAAGPEGMAHMGMGGFNSLDPMCKQISDCPCGSYCVSGENTTCTLDSSEEEDCTCQPGCVLFDMFLGPKSPEEVYGRLCQCGDYMPLVRGRVIWCEKGDWVEQPQGMEITQWNPNCIHAIW